MEPYECDGFDPIPDSSDMQQSLSDPRFHVTSSD